MGDSTHTFRGQYKDIWRTVHRHFRDSTQTFRGQTVQRHFGDSIKTFLRQDTDISGTVHRHFRDSTQPFGGQYTLTFGGQFTHISGTVYIDIWGQYADFWDIKQNFGAYKTVLIYLESIFGT